MFSQQIWLDQKSDYFLEFRSSEYGQFLCKPYFTLLQSMWCSGLADLRSALETTELNPRNFLPQTSMNPSRILTLDLYTNLENMLSEVLSWRWALQFRSPVAPCCQARENVTYLLAWFRLTWNNFKYRISQEFVNRLTQWKESKRFHRAWFESPLTLERPKFLWLLERCKTSKEIKKPVSRVLFISRCSALHSERWSYAMFGIRRTICLL